MNIIGFRNCPKTHSFKLLVELNPGKRTIAWKDNFGTTADFYCIDFPWTYFYLRLENLVDYFNLIGFKIYFAKDQAKMKKEQYCFKGSEVIFPNIIDGIVGYIPCYGNGYIRPIGDNLHDAIQNYLDGFLQIPFSDRNKQIIVGKNAQSINKKISIGKEKHSFKFQKTTNDLARLIYPR